MNLIIKQDIIAFQGMIKNAQDKIDSVIKNREYKETWLKESKHKLELSLSYFLNAIYHSMTSSEYKEIMKSIERGEVE